MNDYNYAADLKAQNLGIMINGYLSRQRHYLGTNIGTPGPYDSDFFQLATTTMLIQP